MYGKFYLLFWLLFLAASDSWLSNPSLPDDILKEAVPGSIRRAEHFLDVLKRLLDYLKHRLKAEKVESEGPTSFVMSLNTQTLIDQKTLKFCYDRLHSLLLTLEITDTDEFLHIQTEQPTVVLLSTEAEYRGAAIATCEVAWLRKLLMDLGMHVEVKVSIYCDNLSSIQLARNPVFHARTKHIEVHYHFVQEQVLAGDIDLVYVGTEEQVADIFTNSLHFGHLGSNHLVNLFVWTLISSMALFSTSKT